jgi:hypothetical protein
METIAAKEGIGWIKQGFALFRRQPAELSMLFLLYMLLMFSLSLIPVIGQLLPLMLVPAFTMAFMQACVEIEADRKVKPSLLLTAFRSPALGTLLKLGAAHVHVQRAVFFFLLPGPLYIARLLDATKRLFNKPVRLGAQTRIRNAALHVLKVTALQRSNVRVHRKRRHIFFSH